MNEEEIQRKIALSRQAGIPEEVIQQKVARARLMNTGSQLNQPLLSTAETTALSGGTPIGSIFSSKTVRDIAKNITEPIVGSAKTTLGGGFEVERALRQALAKGVGLVNKEKGQEMLARTGQKNPFLSETELSEFSGGEKGITGIKKGLERQLGRSAELIAYGIPGGGSLTGSIGKGALAGTVAMGGRELSKNELDLADVGTGTLFGGAGGAVGYGLSKLPGVFRAIKSKTANVTEDALGGVQRRTFNRAFDINKTIQKNAEGIGKDPALIYSKYANRFTQNNFDDMGKESIKIIGEVENDYIQPFLQQNKEKVVDVSDVFTGLNQLADDFTMQGELNKAKAVEDYIKFITKNIYKGGSQVKIGNVVSRQRLLNKVVGSKLSQEIVPTAAARNTARQIEGKLLRRQIGLQSPQIDEALQVQSDMYLLKDIFKNAGTSQRASKSLLSQFNLHSPFSLIDKGVSRPSVVRGISKVTSSAQDDALRNLSGIFDDTGKTSVQPPDPWIKKFVDKTPRLQPLKEGLGRYPNQSEIQQFDHGVSIDRIKQAMGDSAKLAQLDLETEAAREAAGVYGSGESLSRDLLSDQRGPIRNALESIVSQLNNTGVKENTPSFLLRNLGISSIGTEEQGGVQGAQRSTFQENTVMPGEQTPLLQQGYQGADGSSMQQFMLGDQQKQALQMLALQAAASGDERALSSIKTILELSDSFDTQKGSELNVGKVTAQNYGNAQAGSFSLDRAKSLLFDQNGELDRNVIIALKTPGTPSQKARQLKAQLYNVADSYLRLRTGAQANPSEIERLAESLEPGLFDSPATIAEKISIYDKTFGQILGLGQGMGIDDTMNSDVITNQLITSF